MGCSAKERRGDPGEGKRETRRNLREDRSRHSEGLEKQLKTARKNGNREHLEKIQGWQADFEQHKKVPRELSNFKVRRWNAHKELVQAYQEAIQSATKKGDDSLAKDWEASLKDFMESIDPFDQSSVWKGKVFVKTSDKKSKPYEGPVSCKILHRALDRFKVEVNHSHERQWHIEFALEDNVWHAKKLVLTKVQNHFGDPLGPREIFSNRVNFDGSTWTIEVTRKENQGKVQVIYQVQQE